MRNQQFSRRSSRPTVLAQLLLLLIRLSFVALVVVVVLATILGGTSTAQYLPEDYILRWFAGRYDSSGSVVDGLAQFATFPFLRMSYGGLTTDPTTGNIFVADFTRLRYAFHNSSIPVNTTVFSDPNDTLSANYTIISDVQVTTLHTETSNIGDAQISFDPASSVLYYTMGHCVKALNISQPDMAVPVVTYGDCFSYGHADGIHSAARFFYPLAVFHEASVGVLVADFYNRLIRRINVAADEVSTIAGVDPTTAQSSLPHEGPAKQVTLGYVSSLVFDPRTHDLFFASSANFDTSCLKKMNATDYVSIYSGSCWVASSSIADGPLATASYIYIHQLAFNNYMDILLTDIVDNNQGYVRIISRSIEHVYTLAGASSTSDPSYFGAPIGIGCDNNGTVYFGSSYYRSVVSLAPQCDLIEFYADMDNDGAGNINKAIMACYQPIGYANNSRDCNDSDPEISSLHTYYRDQDGDGFGIATDSITTCMITPPPGYVANSVDCNDLDPASFLTNNTEICDGIDNNCNGESDEDLATYIYYRDHDGDGCGNQDINYGRSSCLPFPPDGFVDNNIDCDDNNHSVCSTCLFGGSNGHTSAQASSENSLATAGSSSDALASNSKTNILAIGLGLSLAAGAALALLATGIIIFLVVIMHATKKKQVDQVKEKELKDQAPKASAQIGRRGGGGGGGGGDTSARRSDRSTVQLGREEFDEGIYEFEPVDIAALEKEAPPPPTQIENLDDYRPFQNTDSTSWEIKPSEISILNKIGTGGFGSVYKGILGDEFVALKQVNLDKSDEKKLKHQIASFEKEVSLLAFLRHPNILGFKGAILEMPHVGIVTEYMEHGSLFDYMYNQKNSRKKLTWNQKLKIMHDVAIGMQYLHRMRVLHRDLKSPNILLGGTSISGEDHNNNNNSNNDSLNTKSSKLLVAKIADFGLSKLKDSNAPSLNTQKVGTSLWMAPEVAGGVRYGFPCDVYSYAMIMYEALCEHMPFHDAPKNENIVYRVSTEPDYRPAIKPVRYPNRNYARSEAAFIKLMQRCWAYKPEDRPTFLGVLKELAVVKELALKDEAKMREERTRREQQ